VLQIVGILLAVCFPLSLSLSLVLLFSAAASLILQRDQWTFPIIVICLMMVRWVITQPAISHGAPTDTRISGVVEWIKPSASGNRLKLVSISDRRYTFIFTDRHKKSVLPGDSLILSGTLVRPDPPRNPGQYDYRKYLQQQGISGILTKGEILGITHGRWSFTRQFYQIKNRVKLIIEQFVDPPFSGVMTGLILGDRSGIDDELKDRFQEIGVIHILAVSGLHVGYIYLILSFLATGLNIRGKGQFWVVTCGLCFYMGLTGFTTSVIRASLMAILYSWGKMREKSISTWNIISGVAVIILAVDPMQLFTPGFLLSFGAVWGILFTYPRLKQLDSHFPRWESMRKNRAIRTVTDLIMVTTGAQIGTFIPVALYFKFFPVWGFLANLLIVFLAGLAVISGILTIITSFLVTGFASILGDAGWGILWTVNKFGELIYLLPFRKLPLGGLSTIAVIVLFLLLVFWIWSVGKYLMDKAISLTLLFTCTLVWSSVFTPDRVTITFLDVDQGDSCVIQNGNHTILVDAGYGGFGRDMGKSVILPFLRHEGITHIDLLVMSHPHSDHIGGVPAVLESIPVRTIWDSYSDYRSQVYLRIQELSDQKRIAVEQVRPGEIYQLGTMTLTCIYPSKRIGENVRNINNASIVFRLDHGKNSVLFVGDLEDEGEDRVSKLKTVDHMDVIKIGHHGSITSSSDKFCKKVQPSVGIISLGRDNKFGHPSQTVIQRWEHVGTNLYRTDQTGAVTLVSDGRDIQLFTMLYNLDSVNE